MSTRPSNKTSHPGLAHLRDINNEVPSLRRSHAEVQAERDEKQKKVAAKKQQASENLQRVAEFEATMKQRMAHDAVTLNDVRLYSDVVKSPRPAHRHGESVKVSEAALNQVSDHQDLADTASDNEAAISLHDVSSDSGDEYQQDDPESSVSSDEQEEEMEVDMPDTVLKNKKTNKTKKQKAGVTRRQEVQSITEGILKKAESKLSAKASGKQKETSTPTTGSKRKAEVKYATPSKKARVTDSAGVVDGWEKQTPRVPVISSSIAKSTVSKTSNNEDEPAFQPGGISSDEEVVERPEASTTSSVPRNNIRYRVSPTITIKALSTLVNHGYLDIQTIAKVEDLHVAQLSRSSRRKSTRPQLSDLPQGTTATYTKLIAPMACESSSALDPWENLCDEEFESIWNVVYKDSHCAVKGTPFFKVLKALMEQSITGFRHRFADAAFKALQKDYERRGLITEEERRDHVEYLLGPGEKWDYKSKNRRYLWESVDSLEKTNERTGIFRSALIAYTFSEHLICVGLIPKEYRLGTSIWPIGALMLSISALHRALLCSVSGNIVIPPAKSGQFSKLNWGDFKEPLANGIFKKVKRGTLYKKAINKLSDDDWKALFEKAAATRSEKVVAISRDVVVTEDDDEDSSDDEALMEGSFDTE